MIELLTPGTWTCALHKNHGSAKPIRGAVHHVQPLGAGGADVDSNKVTICSNGHDAVHAVMWEMVNGRPVTAEGGVGLRCAKTELALAKRGVAAWEAAGKPGSIHAFMG